jgi:5'-deoxynucleotidase YfbR-like HD superfamily hydrolase
MISPDWKSLLIAASSDVRRLDSVTRFSSIPVAVHETVSAHMYWVVLYSLMIHRELKGPGSLDSKILIHAATHDLMESVCGDVVRTFKYSSENLRKSIEKAEEDLLEKIDERVRNVMQESMAFLNGDDDEAWYIRAVVKAADFISLYQYMWREKNRSNKEIDQFFCRMQNDMLEMEKKLEGSFPGEPFRQHAVSLSELYHLMSTDDFFQRFIT